MAKRPSKYAAMHRRRELLLRAQMFDHYFNRFSEWLERLKVAIPDEAKRLAFVELQRKRRRRLHAELYGTLKGTDEMHKATPFPVGITERTFVTSSKSTLFACPTFEGVAQAKRFFIDDEYTTWYGDVDEDTVLNQFEYITNPELTWESIRFKQYLEVGDCPGKADIGGLFGFAVMEYEFPAAPCDGHLYYDAQSSFHLTTIREGWGVLNAYLHRDEAVNTGGTRPAYDEFNWHSDAFQSDGGYDYYSTPIAGMIPVHNGERATVFLGVESNLAATEESAMATNGWSYYMVWRPKDQDRCGIHYRFQPD